MALTNPLAFSGRLGGCALVGALAAVAASRRGQLRSLAEEHMNRARPRRRGDSEYAVVLHRLLLHARQVLGAERLCLFALDGEREMARRAALVAEIGPSDQLADRCALDGGLAAVALGSKRPALSPPDTPTLGWQAAVPLGGQRGPLTLLVVGWAEGAGRPGLVELELLSEIAALVAQALGHERDPDAGALKSWRDVEALLDALAHRDRHTEGHCAEVADLAARVARRLGLDDLDQLEVKLAASLHDVGKLRLPAELLRRRGPLSPSEWRLVRRHPQWGTEILAAIPGLPAVAMLVGLHHERPDGAGYPHQLPQQRIPIASRIVSVCDAYTAMTSGRPYQRSVPPAEAINELERNAGTQFDRRIVTTLAKALDVRASLAA